MFFSLLWTYLKEKAKAHPLVVPIQLLIFLRHRRLNPWITLIRLRRLFVLISDRVSRMDPAERVQNVLRYVFRMYTINGIPNILSSRDNQTERNQYEHRDRIMQPEYRRIYVDMADFDESLETAEDVQHGIRNVMVRSCFTFTSQCFLFQAHSREHFSSRLGRTDARRDAGLF